MRIKKMIRIILTMLLLSVFAVIIYAFNPPNGNEIVVFTLQKIHESGEDKFIYVLINKKGQYFLVSEEEMKSVVKSVMEAKEYYSHSKNKPQGRIVNPFDPNLPKKITHMSYRTCSKTRINTGFF